MKTLMPSESSHSRRGYEFGQIENQAFTRLALAMQWVALLELACAALVSLSAGRLLIDAAQRGALPEIARALGYILVPALIGVWTLRAGRHLKLIVRTEGDDIGHLMGAIGELTKLYILQLLLFMLAAGFLAFMFVMHGNPLG